MWGIVVMQTVRFSGYGFFFQRIGKEEGEKIKSEAQLNRMLEGGDPKEIQSYAFPETGDVFLYGENKEDVQALSDAVQKSQKARAVGYFDMSVKHWMIRGSLNETVADFLKWKGWLALINEGQNPNNFRARLQEVGGWF
jgi:hypothetical protein